MPYRVIVYRPVSGAVGKCGLSRRGVLRLLSRLHFEMGNFADTFRKHRDPDDPNLFTYRIAILDGNTWHLCDFSVNDTTAAGILFVEAMGHQSRPK